MKYGQISNSSITGHAGGSANCVSVLPVDETGIVLSAPFELRRKFMPYGSPLKSLSGLFENRGRCIQTTHSEFSAVLPNRSLDDLSFMYAMTYYDRVVYACPVHPLFGHLAAETTAIQKSMYNLGGFEIMPLYPEGVVSDIADMGDGTVLFDHQSTLSFQNGIAIALANLCSRDGARWEMGNGLYGLSESKLFGKNDGLVIRLIDKLPVVVRVADPEHWLVWKSDARNHRAALRSAIDAVALNVDTKSTDELVAMANEISEICDELVALSEQKFPGVQLAPVKFHYSFERAKQNGAIPGIIGGVLGGAIGLPVGLEAAGFLASGIKVEGGPRLNTSIVSDSPFASVVDLQYPR